MNVCLDARLYGLKHAGIGRYVENLVSELKKQNPNDRFTLITQKIPLYSLAEQIRLPHLLNQAAADLYHFPHFNVPLAFNRAFVVTIHDLLWHEVKDPGATTLSPLKHRLKYLGYHLVVKHAVFASKAIIVPSGYVRSQILKHYPSVNPAKIHVIYEGVDEHLLGGRIAIRPYINNPYFLYIGSLYPHKNLEFVISALNGTYPLKIVSSRSVFQDKLKTWVGEHHYSKVTFMGYVPDADLKILIQQAAAVLMPSLSEGFGLPGLEAMALGTPVLASTAGALPEIYGNAAAYFNPHNPADFLEKLNSLPQHRNKLIEAGLARAKQFSWDQTARQTMSLYQRTLI